MEDTRYLQGALKMSVVIIIIAMDMGYAYFKSFMNFEKYFAE